MSWEENMTKWLWIKLIKWTGPNGLLFASVVKQIKAAARAAEDGLAQRLPSAGKGFYVVFKKTKISLDFFGSFFYQWKKWTYINNNLKTLKIKQTSVVRTKNDKVIMN